MEAAFAGSQELVLFVTELNTGAYSVHFLRIMSVSGITSTTATCCSPRRNRKLKNY